MKSGRYVNDDSAYNENIKQLTQRLFNYSLKKFIFKKVTSMGGKPVAAKCLSWME